MDLHKTYENQTHSDSICLPMEMTNATITYLDQLNEDCLLEIFSYLSPMEWCSLAETCKRFKQITPRLLINGFGVKWRFGSFLFEYKLGSSIFLKMVTRQYVERIFKILGQCLSSLELHRNPDLLELVAKYCDDVALRRFVIYGIERISVPLNQMLQRRVELSVNSLIELRIDGTSGPDVALKHTFPNLERLTFGGESVEVGSNICNILFDFISRHGRLKSIKIRRLCDSSVIIVPLHFIDNSCKGLEELTLDCLMSYDVPPIVPNVECFAKLKKLELDFHCDRISYVLPFLLKYGLKSLETMKIRSMDVDAKMIKMFEVVPQLLNLHELHINECSGMLNSIPWTMFPQLRRLHLLTYDNIDYVNIVRQLTNLEEFQICTRGKSNFPFSTNVSLKDFYDIVKVVEQRDHVLRIRCKFDFNYAENCDRKEKVKLIQLVGNPHEQIDVKFIRSS